MSYNENFNKLGIEYSQSKLFTPDNKILVLIKPEDFAGVTYFSFTDKEQENEFYDIVKSWDLFGYRFRKENDMLVYSATQNGPDAYEYSKFMSLIISYFNKDFNKRVI